MGEHERKVVANDDTGQWEVWEGEALLACFDSESLAIELATAPILFETLLIVRSDIRGFLVGDWEGNTGWQAMMDTVDRSIARGRSNP